MAAFSLAPGSKVNARALSHALLTQIEHRGSHASGFAYVDGNGDPGIYKQPKPGSQLSLAEMPRKVKSAILHTRYATQGLPSDNRNNHPVVSTDNRIALVHNGVISNDQSLREPLGITDQHGEVDSIVIPSLIAQEGIKGVTKLAGYAAIAWIDGTEGNGVIRIAKLKQSPVAYTHLADNSFVMASTGPLLRAALDSLDIEYGGVFELAESRMLSVYDGWIYDHTITPAMTYNYRSYAQHSNATSGGHSTGQTRPTGAGTATPKSASSATGTVGSEHTGGTGVTQHPNAVFPKNNAADGTPKSDDEIYAELEAWRQKRAKEDANALAAINKTLAAQAAQSGGDTPLALEAATIYDEDRMTDAEWEAYVDAAMKDQATLDNGDGESCSTVQSRYLAGEGFYIVDIEGDMSHYPTLDDLEGRLKWLAKMGKTEVDLFDVDAEVNWCNHVMDMGSVDEKGELMSWIDDMSDIDQFEMPSDNNLQYIREGVGRLTSLKGA